MTDMKGTRVLITGASSGIGAGCARRFGRAGATLTLWARRADRLQQLADSLIADGATVHTDTIDVRDREAVFDAAANLVRDGAAPHVLINNAGLASGFDLFQDSDPADWDRMIETNITGLLNVTRAIMPAMIEQQRGHVINIGSAAGHQTYPRGNVYAATKHAVRALTEGLNLDAAGTPVRISSVDPGLVETEFSVVRFHGDEQRARKVYEGLEPLTGDDIAEIVFYVATLPAHINILDLVVMPTAQRNVYVIDRH
jgi:3-hydroxy acid dehydrogenase / malonic semialdehyde reductase